MSGRDEQSIDKRAVAASFGAAAGTYDAVAGLQRSVAQRLVDRLQAARPVAEPILDVGCGTGTVTAMLARLGPREPILALDGAEGMLRYARAQAEVGSSAGVHWLGGDAEALPLADASVGTLFSNFTLQWCPDLRAALAECQRVLKPGGRFVCALPGERTLWELRASWQAVDGYTHVNRFPARERLSALLADGGFVEAGLGRELMTLKYRHVRDLSRELKELGAHNVNAGRARGMTGRARMRALEAAYEAYRASDGKLPASYEVLYMEAFKSAHNGAEPAVGER